MTSFDEAPCGGDLVYDKNHKKFDKKVIWAKSGLKIEISMSRELCNKKTVKISAATVFLHSFIKIEHHMGYGRWYLH